MFVIIPGHLVVGDVKRPVPPKQDDGAPEALAGSGSSGMGLTNKTAELSGLLEDLSINPQLLPHFFLRLVLAGKA